jgi:hypothetical protein
MQKPSTTTSPPSPARLLGHFVHALAARLGLVDFLRGLAAPHGQAPAPAPTAQPFGLEPEVLQQLMGIVAPMLQAWLGARGAGPGADGKAQVRARPGATADGFAGMPFRIVREPDGWSVQGPWAEDSYRAPTLAGALGLAGAALEDVLEKQMSGAEAAAAADAAGACPEAACAPMATVLRPVPPPADGPGDPRRAS